MALFHRRNRQAWDGPSTAADYPTQLYNAPSTITPVSLYWFGDTTYLTLVGSDISAVTDPWGGHNASAAANRPSHAGGYGVFDMASSECMALDFSTPEASGDWTFLLVVNNTSNASGTIQTYMSFQTGRLDPLQTGNGDVYVSYTKSGPSIVTTNNNATTGDQYLIYAFKDGNLTEVRRNAVQLLINGAYASTALGGSASIGARYDCGANYGDFKVKAAAIYSGVDSTDILALEAIAAVM